MVNHIYKRVSLLFQMVNKLKKDKEKLEKYYEEVTKIILVRQNAASGLVCFG
jgi:hypothetical protein